MSSSEDSQIDLPQPTPEQVDTMATNALGAGDEGATQAIQNLLLLHAARLTQLKRTVAALKQSGAAADQIQAAEAAVYGVTGRVASIRAVQQQSTTQAPPVAEKGWVLYGYVSRASAALDGLPAPVQNLTVFLTDANKTYQRAFGFSYTDSNGRYVLSYTPDAAPATRKTGSTASAAGSELFIGVVDADGDPIYPLPDDPRSFTPKQGIATLLDIVLPADGKPVGDPPQFIREIALPKTGKKSKEGNAK